MDTMKSSIEEIRSRFDNDVERFSNLETGQSSTIDAALMMALTTQSAALTNPESSDLLDVGCGAGNYTLKLLESLPNLNVTLVDLSRPMLDRAVQRISAVSTGAIQILQGDIRELEISPAKFDIILAAAVLHHLREDEEWRAVFSKFHSSLKPGGSVWIVDLITHTNPSVQTLMKARYGEYLTSFKNEAYRDHVFNYIEKEDTPRPLLFQLDMLRDVGFQVVEILHKNSCFAAFGAIKCHTI
jgi:tRNA (cmo5U34)-methyltransferase